MTEAEIRNCYIVTFKVANRTSEFPEILLFEDPGGRRGTSGALEVGESGAIITFEPAREEAGFDFENLVIHPLGRDTSRVDLQWKVDTETDQASRCGPAPEIAYVQLPR